MTIEDAEQHYQEGGIMFHQNQLLLSSTNDDNTLTTNHTIATPSLGSIAIECPDLNCVLFRNGGPAWDHPGNVKFQSILIRREKDREKQKTMAQKDNFLKSIVQESFAEGLIFLSYDDKNEWYVEITDYTILRKKVFQALRDQSARRKRLNARAGRKKVHQVSDSNTSLFMALADDPPLRSTFLNFKKQKRNI